MPKEREDVEAKSSDSPEVYQQTRFMAWFEKAFPWLLCVGAALGLILMIFLPVIFFQEKTAEQLLAQSNLRLALLYTTGGTIAALGLLETYRKNTNDRTKANADINAALKNQDHQTKVLKEQIRQFDENAFKERKAERRERYTKAVEQLGDEKAPVRMGGVYTLVGLVDEWLEEENLPEDERLKEGQVIINNLCAYIRFPFTLASYYDELSKDSPISDGIYKDKKEEFYVDKAILDSEADVRLGIIKEIHDRLQGSGKNTPGAWSDFEYDFSGSTFFYPIDLTNSYYAKPINFSGSTYKDWVYFSDSTYKDWADFRRSTYQGWADFSRSTYKGKANFSNSAYEKNVIFSTSYFSPSIYEGEADFSRSTYKGKANFSNSAYEKNVIFSTSDSRSTYEDKAYFSDSTYQAFADFRRSTYKSGADFSDSTYEDKAYFSDSTYQGWAADFRGSTYQGWADFSGSTYQTLANFNGSTYEDKANFSGSTYQTLANFNGSTYEDKAYFSGSTYQTLADFSGSTYQGEANFNGSTYEDKANFNGSTYEDKANFRRSTYQALANFSDSTYQDVADFSGSIFYQKVYFGVDGDNSSFSRFTDCAPQFYDETNHKNTLFGSPNNDFTVENGRGYPIYRSLDGLPLGCKFLTSEQKEYLEGKLQEIEKINNKLREVKDPKEKEELLKKLQALNKELYEWRGGGSHHGKCGGHSTGRKE